MLSPKVLLCKVAEASSVDNTVKLASDVKEISVPKPLPPPSKASKALFEDEPILTSEIRNMMVSNRLLLNSVKKNNFMLRPWKGRDVIESDTLSKLREMDKELQPFLQQLSLTLTHHIKRL